MKITRCDIEGPFIIEPEVFGDNRGYFFESYSKHKLESAYSAVFGRDFGVDFVQDNESFSRYGVVRGLHFQKGEHAQAKLVRVVSGKVFDVAVDIRPGSETFGKYVPVVLSGEDKRQFFIPRGFAHGFAVLSETAVFQYKCDNYYCPSSEGGIIWNDPAIGIEWPLPERDMVFSEKDLRHPGLDESVIRSCSGVSGCRTIKGK